MVSNYKCTCHSFLVIFSLNNLEKKQVGRKKGKSLNGNEKKMIGEGENDEMIPKAYRYFNPDPVFWIVLTEDVWHQKYGNKKRMLSKLSKIFI